MKNIIFYKKNRTSLILAIIFKFFGFKTFSINNESKIKNTKVLPLAPSKISTEIENRANYDIDRSLGI